MSYKNLEIWKLSRQVVNEIHPMRLGLPDFEQYEITRQIRKSCKSVKSNIVEGYGRRKYKNELLRFLIYAQASNDETIDHPETLFETGSLKSKDAFDDLHRKTDNLGKKINRFIQVVNREHNILREDQEEYFLNGDDNVSNIQDQESSIQNQEISNQNY